MQKYLIIAGVALAVVLIARKAQAAPAQYNPANWRYLPNYKPQTGVIT